MEIDLRRLCNDEVVLHFGGLPREVNAFTFANSLLAFSEALREINQQVNPGSSIEVAIDAVGTGSFRAKIKTRAPKVAGFIAQQGCGLVVGIMGSMIYDKYLGNETKIVVQDDSYIVERGDDRIILPREVYVAKEALREPARVDAHISKGFEVLEQDPSITEFGLTSEISDPEPALLIERAKFDRMAIPREFKLDDSASKVVKEKTDLVVLKPILERSKGKWQFVWRGIKIYAPIDNKAFFDRLAAREYEFGQGDTISALLAIHQTQDPATGVYMNDSYVVLEVYGHKRGPKQLQLPGTLSP